MLLQGGCGVFCRILNGDVMWILRVAVSFLFVIFWLFFVLKKS